MVQKRQFICTSVSGVIMFCAAVFFYFNGVLDTNYLGMYRTDLYQIFRIGTHCLRHVAMATNVGAESAKLVYCTFNYHIGIPNGIGGLQRQ